MINIRTIKKMQDGDTLNIKNGKIKKYKSGYQINTHTIFWARVHNRVYGTLTIQFKNGKYYLSSTKHAYTRRQAREIANEAGQNIIYDWNNLAHQAV